MPELAICGCLVYSAWLRILVVMVALPPPPIVLWYVVSCMLDAVLVVVAEHAAVWVSVLAWLPLKSVPYLPLVRARRAESLAFARESGEPEGLADLVSAES